MPKTYTCRDVGVDCDWKTSAETEDEIIAISTRCVHLGCPVRYVEAAENFICPCHGGVYDFQGLVVGGPPVRPLDRFQTRARAGQVEIGPRYSVTSRLQAVRTRQEVFDRVEAQNALVAACHFPEPGFGHLVRVEGRRYWQGI